MENIQENRIMMLEGIIPKFSENPSLQDLEEQLEKERDKLIQLSFLLPDERHQVISRIRMLRSSISILQGYLQHFGMN